MAQSTAPAEPHITPPPLPIRSHLRNGSAYQQRLRTIKFEPMSSGSPPSSPVSQTLFEELERDLTETQQRLVSTILEERNMSGNSEILCWDIWEEGDNATERGLQSDGTSGDGCCSGIESEMDYQDDHPEPLRLGGKTEDFVGQTEVQERMPAQRGSHDSPPLATHTNHASCSVNSSPSSNYSIEMMDTKVSDWLARGFLTSDSHESDSRKQLTSNTDRPFPPRLANLSIFPPTSPSTGNREYTPPGSPFSRPVCPMSPLSNGRDAYGNYIASNKRDYFTPQSPPTSPSIPAIQESRVSQDQTRSSPIVRLRGGGWNGLKSFWKASDTEEPDQGTGSSPLQSHVDKDGVMQDVSTIQHAELAGQAPRSVRSHFSTTRVGKDTRTTQGIPGRPSAIDTKRDNQFAVGRSDVRPGSNTPDSTDTDGSSVRRARADAVLYQHFGPQLSPPVPISPGTQPLTIRKHSKPYGRADVPARDGPRSPPIDRTFALPNSRSALSPQANYTGDSTNASQPVAKTRPTSWDPTGSQKIQKTESTAQSYVLSPRNKKRWDMNNPPPPPRLPPPNPPKYLRAESPEDDASAYSDDDSQRAPSAFSANTADDKLIDLLGLKSTDAYRKVAHEREVQRIQDQRQWHEEADRRHDANVGRQEEVGQREPDLNTIVPDDSITAVMRRQHIERLHDLERMAVVDEYRPTSSPAPSQYLPRHGRITAKAQVIPQQQGKQFQTIGYPSVVSAQAGIEPASIKRKHSLQTVLSKAGKLTRIILAAPSDPKYKTYSQRHPPVKSNEKKQSGMSADATGWPRNSKASSSATYGMFVSIQAPRSRTMFGSDRPKTSEDDTKTPDNRGWEHPRGRRVKGVEKGEDKRWRGKWKRGSNEETYVGETQVMDFASRDIRRGKSLDISASIMKTHAARSKGATRLQHPGYARSGPRARSPSPEMPTPNATSAIVAIPVSSTHHKSEHTFIPSDAVGTSQTRFGLPDSEGKCYVSHPAGEDLPFNPALGYPYHSRLNTYHDLKTADAATLNWLEGIRAQTDAITEPVLNMRGGGGSISPPLLSTNGEASSLASHHRVLTSAAMSVNSGNVTIVSTDIDTQLTSSTHLNLGGVTHKAIAAVNRADHEDTRPSSDEANIRSSFSTDSTVELRRNKKAKESVWRNEDQARAMAMVMHFLG